VPSVRLRYDRYDRTTDRPNVIVDGSANEGTVLTISHWPGSPPLPASVQADLSAQMAFRYLDHDEVLHDGAEVVSNNHFDQDGLVGVFALVHPDEAMARRAVLEDVAAAGDFGTYQLRDAARVSMVIAAWADPERAALGPLSGDYADDVAWLYGEGLGRLAELVDDIDRHRALWGDEDRQLSESEAAVAAGTVAIDEVADVDVAVVTVPDGHWWTGHRFGGGRHYDGVHPMAVDNATACNGLLLVAAGTYRFTYRYETWVQYRSRSLRPRVDLVPLADRLSALDDVEWTADAVDVLTPDLGPVGGAPSSLAPDVVTGAIVEHLRHAPPAFDPFRPGAP
jgi:hypothetical protein